MKEQEKQDLKKAARVSLNAGDLSIAKENCKTEIDRNLRPSMRKELIIIESDKLCFYIKKNKQLHNAIQTIENVLTSSGKTTEQLLEEFKNSRKHAEG